MRYVGRRLALRGERQREGAAWTTRAVLGDTCDASLFCLRSETDFQGSQTEGKKKIVCNFPPSLALSPKNKEKDGGKTHCHWTQEQNNRTFFFN